MASMPDAHLAVVEDSKLAGYILNPNHKVGWAKGSLLVAHGFAAADVEALRRALLDHARTHEIASSEATQFGVKYRIDGPLPTPSGVQLQVRTVWQIDTGQSAPRFVTLKPLPRQP